MTTAARNVNRYGTSNAVNDIANCLVPESLAKSDTTNVKRTIVAARTVRGFIIFDPHMQTDFHFGTVALDTNDVNT